MKEIIRSQNAPAALGPYNHAIAFGQLVFTSGQLGIDPASGKFAQGVEAQARLALENLKNVLEAAGSSLQNVVKATIFVQDLADFPKVNAVYAEFFGPDYPARSCVEVAALPGGGLVECECIALRNR